MNRDKKTCPHCDEVLDFSQEISGDDIDPMPGDYSICISCTNFLVYDDELNLIKIPEDDEMPEDILDQLLEVKFRIEMQQQAHKFGEEFQKTLMEK